MFQRYSDGIEGIICIFVGYTSALFYPSDEIVRQIFTSTARMRLLENGIVHYSYLPNAEIDYEQQVENTHAFCQLLKERRYPLLFDGGELVNYSNKARFYIRKHEEDLPILCRAFVTKSLINRININLYYLIHRSAIPHKVFNEYSEAVTWLLEMKAKYDAYPGDGHPEDILMNN